MVVYVNTQGARITREGRHLIVRKEGEIHHTLFVYKLQQLVVMGNVTVTPQALKLLLKESIDTVFTTLDGRYVGRLAGGEMKNVFLRKRQFQLADDEPFRVSVAREIVSGKIANMNTVLNRIERNHRSDEIRRAASILHNILNKVPRAENIDTLMGYEGNASAVYFPAYAKGFRNNPGFTRRVRRPPTDPVNSVLSLLYTFLINRAYAAVRIAGLDPYPGFLHALDYGRHSLPLDLVEEFRPMIADTIVLTAFNLGALRDEHFVRVVPSPPPEPAPEPDPIQEVIHDPLGLMSGAGETEEDLFDMPPQSMEADGGDEIVPSEGKYPVRLTPEAFKRVVTMFENRMNTTFTHPTFGKQMTYQEAMIHQARQLRRIIEGESIVYQPLLLR